MPDIYIFKEYSLYMLCIYNVYTWYIQWHLHIQGIFIVYAMYIQCIYMVYTVTSTYSRNILCIYHVYTMYIHCIYSDIYIFKEYSMYLPCIYNVYTCAEANLNWIYIVYYAYILPGGWCWGGGQGPIPPAPPAITSPGRVLTFILLHSCAHLGFLLLVMWMRRARLEQ
jgi:hypothetical protein